MIKANWNEYTALKKIMASMSGHAIEYNHVQTNKSGCEGMPKLEWNASSWSPFV